MPSRTATSPTGSKVADSDDVLQKADAFMRRHRVFVAGAAAPAAEEPVPEQTAAEDDADIPVLTEVVVAEPAAAPAATTIDPAELKTALAAELDAWLDEQLPAHVMRVLDGITDQMIGQVSEKVRSELLPRLQERLEAAPTAPDQGSGEV